MPQHFDKVIWQYQRIRIFIVFADRDEPYCLVKVAH